MTAEPTLSILFVCTGNICRSALAERVLRAAVDRSDIEVLSAGTQGGSGIHVTPDIVALAAANGATMDGFGSRFLVPDMVRAADLVLTATTAHRAAILRETPGALRRTFTVLEFVAADPGVSTRPGRPGRSDLLEQILARSRRRPTGPVDIVDPYGAGPDRYAEMAASLLPAVRSISDWLTTIPDAEERVQ